MSSRGGRGRGGRPPVSSEQPYGGRGGGGGRGGRGGAPVAPLIADTISTKDIKDPPVGSTRVLPHLFGGLRSQVEAAQRADAKGEVAESLAQVTLKPPADPSCSTAAGEVTTNLFPIKVQQEKAVYQYDLVVEPECGARARARLVREALPREMRQCVAVRRNIVYSAKQLCKGKEPFAKTLTSAAGGPARKVTLKFTTTVPTEGNGGFSTDQYTLWASILADALERTQLTKIGGVYYDLDNTVSAEVKHESSEHGTVSLTPGLRVALMPLQKGLFLQVDLLTRVTRSCTVLDEIEKMRGAYKNDWKGVVEGELSGVIAATNYCRESRKQTFKITKVRFDLSPASEIPSRPGAAGRKGRTFAQYMKEVNAIEVKDMKQPLLECQSATEKHPDGTPVVRFFIPELSRLVGQTKKMLGDTELQRALKEQCLVPSDTRFQRVFDIVKKLTSLAAFRGAISDWGIAVDPKLVTVPARVMERVSVKNGGGKVMNEKDGKKWLVAEGTKIPECPKAPKKWTFAYPSKLKQEAKSFLETLMKKTINGVGAQWPNPEMQEYQAPSMNPTAILKTFEKEVLPEVDPNAEFLLAVLPTDDEKVYAAVKKATLVTWSIPSQCVQFKNVRNERNHLNVSSRVGGQMLVKAGGTLWTVESKGSKLANALICGVDFERAPPPAMGKKNVLGLVAISSDRLQYVGEYTETFQDSAGAAIRGCVKAALRDYKKVAGKEPSVIIMYRSGMDEGDVPRIAQQEVAPILEECKGLSVRVCFVASLKRTHTRLLKCKSGTIIDKHVLPHTGFSFFMVPQDVNMGTATAMKFTTLHNSVPSLTGEELERLTFQLCHHFFGWWGVTREPSVLMYAKRLAKFSSITGGKVAASTGGFQVL